MFGSQFYHSTIKKYVAIFGTLFDDISIVRKDSSNTTVQTFKVPLAYGPATKFLVRNEEDADLNRNVGYQLPRISFELTSFRYDHSRMLNKQQRRVVGTATETSKSYLYTPVPYNFYFTMSVIAKTIEDGSKIGEQILPFFRPNVNISAKLLQDSNINDVFDIQVNIENTNTQDRYEGPFIQGRPIIWEIQFTMKGYLFNKISSSKIIKTAYVNFYTTDEGFANNTPDETMTVIPYMAGTSLEDLLPTDDYSFVIEIDTNY